MKVKTSQKLCLVCGFKKRGKKHDEGDHHTKGKFGSYATNRKSRRK